ncbi:hypothetical protein HanXRQr2_Chr12g0523471 [Helianthus annuus]|uniref:Uncharacterized protein n=1 Tax=Helianthus annuus TaxID=4232 RepID=A0A9K3HD07_HELAN|nr:hypothetical protein HanXRQr2_Chr12g0523471 [Helianthus annuus]
MKSESLVGILWGTISNELKNRRYPSAHRGNVFMHLTVIHMIFWFLHAAKILLVVVY